ncbi:NeuD/PglB/VioB family sugar acetyltransferase [Acetatifactor muris]|uniref:NeuD/PglB/VioB family sugar acetyltransferase n=1 Tax=Acetatifactor muris TaxID=879566 RepID=UPI0023F0E757|nr:NeuD/PglB/VioB family sugar acetyltransferase [Acetatifactor muris]
MMKKDIVIVGASGFAQEIKWLIDRINSATPCWNFLGYINNCASDGNVIGNDDYLCNYSKELYVVVAIADTALRCRLAALFHKNGLLKFPNLIDPSVIMSEAILTGEGNIICAGSVLTVGIEIGNFCIINLDCTVGHGAVVEDFVTVNPSVNISGNARLSKGVSIGTGSQILQGRCVGENTVIGAGSVVLRDIPNDCTAVGVPAKVIKDRRK